MAFVSILLALAAGAGMAFHAGVNAEMARWMGSPIRGAFMSFAVGVVFLGVLAVLVFKPWPSASRLGHAPWWAWLGGILGSLYIIFANIAAPRLGAAAFIAFVVAAQTIASLAIDRFGLVGFAERGLTPGRIAGAVLLVAGVALVRFA